MRLVLLLGVLWVSVIEVCFVGSIAGSEPAVATATPFVPDPLAVTRYGAAWRYPQAGWNVVHIEGSPYDRGYQHGRLLAREIVDYCQTIARIRSHQAPDKAWRDLRLFVNALFLRRFDPEYLREMQGIADGAAAAGAKFEGRPLDLIDIVVINADVEVGFLDAALEGTATGLDRLSFPGRHSSLPKALHKEHCSAFVATGPATADGKIVMGHITMSDLVNVRFFNVWLDIQPANGHRMVFQTFPGGIQSGLDYYITDAGLIVAETTIDQTKFNPQGEMIASRIRRVVQYAESIDRCVEILTSSNNGLYTNEWLFGDLNTNEIAMFELGTDHSRLWRSSRNEWVAGTTGFYWGCNNVKDVGVFKETVPDLGGKPANLVLYPRIRDEAWLKLFERRKGTIAEAFGFEAFSTPPLVGYPSCDAKFTTAAMAKDLKTWALFGPPLGKVWTPSESDRETLPSVQPLVPNDWTSIDVKNVKLPPSKSDGEKPKHLSDANPFPKKDEPLTLDFDAIHPFAWRGTLLPATDADIWLAAGFSEYEKVVSLEHAVHREENAGETHPSADEHDDDSGEGDSDTQHKHGDLSQQGKDLADLALFQHESQWLTASRRVGRDIPLSETRASHFDRDWYRIAAGKGTLLFAALRRQLGDDKFIHCLDEFGQANAGQSVTTDQFRKHLQKTAGTDAVATLDHWQTSDLRSEFESHNPWSIFSYEAEPNRVLIVFGTQQDEAAQRDAAKQLQIEVARRFNNIEPPVKSDRDVTDEDLSTHHLLLIGRPAANRVTARSLDQSKHFPVKFSSQSFVVGGRTYSHPDTFVIAAGDNPFSARYSAVVFAGLNATSTWKSARNLIEPDEPSPQVVVSVVGKRTRHFRYLPQKH